MTENGDKAFATTGDACLDFFVRITRSAPLDDYINTFIKAWNENQESALKLLYNLRDVRGGKGEKLIPVVIMFYLKLHLSTKDYELILKQFLTFGCWKDLLKIAEIDMRLNNKLTNNIELKLFANQLQQDYDDVIKNNKAAISLCGKWAPSEKLHFNKKPLKLVAQLMKLMKKTPKEYRLMLTTLRNHLHVLETLMATNRCNDIDFSKISSKAMLKHKNAFNRDCNSNNIVSTQRSQLKLNYEHYLSLLQKGETKVNVKGLQPHELIHDYNLNKELDILIEEQWKTLKNDIQLSNVFRNTTAVVDVSGSMQGQPMEVAIALGILVAECTKGPYYGQVITFHENPTWHKLIGQTLKDQVYHLQQAPWGGSTDMRKVFDLILQHAIHSQCQPDECIKTLFIFTDMQFNQCDKTWQSAFEYAQKQFNTHGYTLPQVICWNLRTSTSKCFPTTKNEEGFVMLSGFSSELLKCVLSGVTYTPLMMLNQVLSPYPTTTLNYELNKSLEGLEDAIHKSKIKKTYKKIK